MKKIFFLVILTIGFYAQSAVVQCPERYPNGNRLIDGDVLRYQNGNRLKDGDVWRFLNGNRLVDGDVWRYENGNRLVDGDVWRYENGNRLRDGDVIRYENGNRLRDGGVFKSESGQTIGGDFYSHSFSSASGMSVDVELTKITETFKVNVEDSGHYYELSYDPKKGSQPLRIKCILDQSSSGATSFRLETNAASLDVKVKNGYSPAEVRRAITDALNNL